MSLDTAASSPQPAHAAPGNRRASRRAVLIGLALVPFNVWWVLVAELRWYVILTLNPLFVTPVFYLAVLALANRSLRRWVPRWALTGPELVTIYVMLVLSCAVATHDFIINLMTIVPWPRWFASPSNGWENTMFPHLPRWLYVWDKELLAGAFKGDANLYSADVLLMWARPLAFWSVFIASIGWTCMCMNVLVRRAWVEHTRLSFPIVRLPVALTEDDAPRATMRSRALWAGAIIAVGISALNGLHEWYPSLPVLQVRAQPLTFPAPPWSTTAPLFLTLYPFAIGLAFLVPLDVSFSCWFFYLFMKAQSVIGWQLGYGDVPDYPYVSEQAIGAWLTFGVFLVAGMRGHLKGVVASAIRGGRDEGEPMSYRLAFFGMLAGMLVFGGFWWLAGMSPGWVVAGVAIYFLLALCITRVRAEAGGQHTVWDLEPMRLMRLFDSRLLGPGNLVTGAMSHWYWRLNRSHAMPNQLEAFRLAQEHRMDLRSLVWPMLAAFGLASVVGMWACLRIFYAEGATASCVGWANWTGFETYEWLGSSLGSGYKAEPGRWGAIGGAAGLMVVLSWLRTRYAGFPFHPLGYCIGPGLLWLWFPFMVAWLLKLLILRYGGLRMYRRAVPFFLGLVLGDYMGAAIWSLIGVTFHVPVYQFFH